VTLVAPLPAVATGKRSRLWGVPVSWHLLSLDAPTVAVLWAWSFARTAETGASLTAIAVLGIGTWLIYVADRLLDARSPLYVALRERHFFHARHRAALLRTGAVAAALLFGLIGIMPTAAREQDTVLFAAATIYFASVHLPKVRVRRWFPREVAAGILFALATAVPAWSAAPWSHLQLAGPVLLFAGLCTLNILAIESWEGDHLDSIAVPVIALGVALASITLALLPGRRTGGETGIYAASFLSALLLLALDGLHRNFERRPPDSEWRARFLLALRVSADAVLLTPIFFLLPWHP